MPAIALRLCSWSSSRRTFLIALLGALGLACAAWLWVRHEKVRPLVITLQLQYSSPLSRQYFEHMELRTSKDTQTENAIFITPQPILSEPTRKVWHLDPAIYAGFKLDLRDDSGILMPWKREVLLADFDTLARQSRRVDLSIGGNTAKVSFRIGDQKLGEPEYWRYTLVSGSARLLQSATGAQPEQATGTQEGSWRLVERTLLLQNGTCQFALISPGDYRVELLDSASKVMLAGPLHVPSDSEHPQQLEAHVERP